MLRALRIHRYVLSELILPTLLALGIYLFLLLMNEFFLVAKEAVARQLSTGEVVRLFVYQIPRVFVLSLPMATLLGTMIGIGRLSADHEWVALQSAGLGPGALIRPALVHGLGATLIALVVFSEFFPVAHLAMRGLRGAFLARANLAADLRPRVFYSDLPGTLLYVDEIHPGEKSPLSDLLIYQSPEKPGGSEALILARRGDLYPSADQSGGLELALTEGQMLTFRSEAPEGYIVSKFARSIVRPKTPDALRVFREPPRPTVGDMNSAELVRESRAATADTTQFIGAFRRRAVWLEINTRLALPSACLFFALLSVPLGVTRARSGKGAGFTLSTVVVFVYWLVFTLMRNQAARGNLPVMIGVWAANFLIAAWIAYAFWKMPGASIERRSVFARLAALVARLVPKSWKRRAREAQEPSRAEARANPSGFLGIADRYLMVEYLKIVGLALMSTYLVYIVVEVKRLLDGIYQSGQPVEQIGLYLVLFAPGMLQFTLPVSCLVAGIVTISILGRRGELTALKAAGMSMRRAMAPIFGVTALMCLILFLIQDRVAPGTNRHASEVRDRILGRAATSYGRPVGGRWTFGQGGRLYQYRLYDPVAQQFQGLSVFTVDRARTRIADHAYAATAKWNGTAWELSDGWKREFPFAGGIGAFKKFSTPEAVTLDPPDTFSQRENTLNVGGDLPDYTSVEELGEQITQLENSGYDTARLKVGYWAKWSQPFTPLVMLLLGAPFAFRIGRSGSLYAIGISLLLVILYWATLAVFNALGLETLLPPLLAAWAPTTAACAACALERATRIASAKAASVAQPLRSCPAICRAI